MPAGSCHALVIEDEEPIRRFLRAALAGEGYRVEEARSGEEGLKLAVQHPPDILILDLGLPGVDGQEVLRQLREWFSAPIIVLSARDQEHQKIQALDHGADDYISKPFGVGELLARMRTALRHVQHLGGDLSEVSIGDLRIDLAARSVFRGARQIHLTPLEYKLLTTFVKNSGKALTHRHLLREVWGPEDSRETHYVRVFVANLRRKLEDDSAQPRFILTEQGVGYRFASE
jgi:two-component system KDP operon response regulator KdpE